MILKKSNAVSSCAGLFDLKRIMNEMTQKLKYSS
jgi:hypothetical protein